MRKERKESEVTVLSSHVQARNRGKRRTLEQCGGAGKDSMSAEAGTQSRSPWLRTFQHQQPTARLADGRASLSCKGAQEAQRQRHRSLLLTSTGKAERPTGTHRHDLLLGNEVKSHPVEQFILLQHHHGHRVHLIEVEVELHPRRRVPQEVPPVLGRTEVWAGAAARQSILHTAPAELCLQHPSTHREDRISWEGSFQLDAICRSEAFLNPKTCS